MSAQLINLAGASGGILVDARNTQFMSENVIVCSVFLKKGQSSEEDKLVPPLPCHHTSQQPYREIH